MTTTVETAIYRLKYEGLEQAYQAAAALSKVEVAEEQLTKATRASVTGFERQLAALDPAVKAYQQYQRSLEQVSRWQAAGIGTDQQRAHLIEQATRRYAAATAALGRQAVANDNVAKSTGLAAHQMQNLGFQINDVVSGLAMGQSPFTIMAQQGAQVYQILSMAEGGVGGALRHLKDMVLSILTPGRLLVGGFLAAGGAAALLYKTLSEDGRTAEQNLEEHARLLGIIKDAYNNAADAAGRFFSQGKEVTLLQALQNVDRLRANLQTYLAEATKSLTAPTSLGMPEMGVGPDQQAAVVRAQYKVFAGAIAELQAGINRGMPDLERFNREVAEIGINNPALRATAERLIEIAKNSTDMARDLSVASAMVRYIQGTATEADKTLLSLAGAIREVQRASEPDQFKQFADALEKLRRLGGKAFEGEKLARDLAAAKDAFNQGLIAISTSGSLEEYNAKLKVLQETYRRTVAGIHEANKESVTAYDTLIQRTKDRIAELQLEAQQAGMTAGEVIKLKTAHDLERAAKASNKTVTEEMREEWRKLGEEIAEATRQRNAANVRADIEWQKRTMSLTDSERQIANALRPIYGPEIQRALESKEAADLRQIERYREMRDALNDLAQDLFRAFTSGGNAIESFTRSLAGLATQLASRNLSRFLNGGSFFGNQNLGSMAGLAGMAGAGAMGYQSGSPLMGALGGAMAGATFGPWGAVAGGIIGGVGGLFGMSSQKKQQQQADWSGAMQIMQQSRLIGIDTDTRAGAIEALTIQQQAERQQAVMDKNWAQNLALAELHRKQLLELNKEWDKRELEIAEQKRQEELRIAEESAKQLKALRASYEDRILAATTDAQTLDGALALFERQAQRERESLRELGLLQEDYSQAVIELEKALNAERLKLMNDFSDKAVEETRRLMDALNQAAVRVADYLAGINRGPESPLSPGARLSAAQAAYNATLGLAQGGNLDALNRITQDAEALRQAAQAMFGSAAGYQQIFNQINQQLAALPAVSGSTDPVVEKLIAVVQAVQANKTAVDQAKATISATVQANKTAVDQAKATISATSAASDAIANAQKSLLTTQNSLTNTLISWDSNQYNMLSSLNSILAAVRDFSAIQRNIGNSLGNTISAGFSHASTQLDAIAYNTYWSAIADAKNGRQANGTTFNFHAFQKGGVVPGYAGGGIVGNGIFNVDSVRARYAAGGEIIVAGGEGILTASATRAIGGPSSIDYINRNLALPANNNGGIIAAIDSLNRNLSMMLSRIAALEEKNVQLTAALLDQNENWQADESRSRSQMMGRAGRAA